MQESEIANLRPAGPGRVKDGEEEEAENLRVMFSARIIRPNRLNTPLKPSYDSLLFKWPWSRS